MTPTKRHAPASPHSPNPHTDDDDYELLDSDGPPLKKRATRTGVKSSTGKSHSEKAARKEARMERNRIAAQVSRDRKKHLSESLETRVAELEAQLDATSSSASSSSSTRHVVPPHPRLSPSPVDTSYLEEENLSLRLQLQLEQSNGAALKLRLVSLEESFSRLERLLGPGLPATIPTTTLPLTPAADFPMDASATSEEFVDETSFRLPAAGLVEPYLSQDVVTSPPPSSFPLHAPFVHYDPDSPPPLLFDPLDEFLVGTAWSDWANQLPPVSTGESGSFFVEQETADLYSSFFASEIPITA